MKDHAEQLQQTHVGTAFVFKSATMRFILSSIFLLQRMPGEAADPDAWNRITGLASTLMQGELLELEPRRLLERLYHEEDVRLFRQAGVKFGCKCSSERVARMLQGLGEAEARSILEERGAVDVRCEYCGRGYRFDPVDIGHLFADAEFRLPDAPGMQ